MTSKYYFNGSCCYNLEHVSFIFCDINTLQVEIFILGDKYVIRCKTSDETEELYKQIINQMISLEKENNNKKESE